MGTWDAGSFGNDIAVDWTYGLTDGGTAYIEAALDAVATRGSEEVDATLGVEAVAAAEVVARLGGKPGTKDSYSETADGWVKAHGRRPSPALVRKAIAALDRVTQPPSELLVLWQDSDETEWTDAINDLRNRLAT
jgi:hypothetical protein